MRHPLCRLRRLPPLLREGDAPDGRGNPVHGCPRTACSAAIGWVHRVCTDLPVHGTAGA